MEKFNFSGLTGEVITWFNPLYDEARQEWNRAIEKYPIAIVYCINKYDVSNAIVWARRNCIGFRIRSGDHNYEGYSVGNMVLVIDISRMNKIKVIEDRNIVKVQGGVRNREFYEAVSTLGYPLPGGSCPTVGVSGYILGGGWGYSSRYLGLGCDSLREIEIIDYKGRIIIANSHKNSALFWACRGAGGGSFGVVVSLTYTLPKKVEGVTLLSVYYPNCTDEKLVDIFEAVQGALPNLDNRLTTRTSIYNSREEGIASFTRGIFYGSISECLEVIKFLSDIEGVIIDTEYFTFIEAYRKLMADFPPYEHFKSTGRFVYREYTRAEIQGFIKLIMTKPENSIVGSIDLYALGGAVSDVPSADTAYFYRQASYILGIQSVWFENKYKEENVKWVEEGFKYVYPLTIGSFVNFPYAELKDYEEEYFGGNKYKLRSVKSFYDPCNVFKFPQSIKLNICKKI
jgi:hypothetical protein